MHKTFSLLSLALLACPVLPLTAASQSVFPFQYTQEDLPNGLRVITIPTDFPNIVSVFIVTATGSRNEVEPGKSGFAHLFEHLMFRGTPEFSPTRYQQVLSEAGAASNAYTTDDYTAYHTTFSKEDLPRILSMEADRFQHLAYAEPEFKTETLAVLGEYNKSAANPALKLSEAMRETAFRAHTYSHTTLGFLKDIQAMPNEYEYSRQFFSRYYRPEYTTIIVAGDVTAKRVRELVDERWGEWKRGSYKPAISVEPAQDGPRTAHVDWPAQTLPWVSVGFRAPAYSDDTPDEVALDAIARLGFDETSALYQKLVIQEQKVDTLRASMPDRVDPELFHITARVKNAADLGYVQEQILGAAKMFGEKPADAGKLEALKQHLRYRFALELNDSEAIAGTVAQFVALRRSPATIDKYFETYGKLTPEDLQKAAQKYLTDKNRTIVTLTSAAAAGGAK